MILWATLRDRRPRAFHTLEFRPYMVSDRVQTLEVGARIGAPAKKRGFEMDLPRNRFKHTIAEGKL